MIEIYEYPFSLRLISVALPAGKMARFTCWSAFIALSKSFDKFFHSMVKDPQLSCVNDRYDRVVILAFYRKSVFQQVGDLVKELNIISKKFKLKEGYAKM